MKKYLFLILLSCCFTAMNAQKTKTTYYGTKASQGDNNPCKNATSRVCGTIETEVKLIHELDNMAYYREIRTIKDCDNLILSKFSNDLLLPISVNPIYYIQQRDFTNFPHAIIGDFPIIGGMYGEDDD